MALRASLGLGIGGLQGERFTDISDETVKPFDGAAKAINALFWCSNGRPVHHMASVVIAYEFNSVLALMEGNE